MKTTQAMELVIIEGGQAGARSRLTNGKVVEIGGSLESDIILNDPLIAEQKIKLAVEDGGAAIDVLAGEVQVMGERFVEGERVSLSAYQMVTIGDTSFAYGEVGSASWHQLVAVGQSTSESLRLAEEDIKPLQHTLGEKVYWLYAALATLLLLVAVGIYLASKPQQQFSMAEHVASVNLLLSEAGFTELKAKVDGENSLVIDGYIASAEHYAKLERLLDGGQLFARINVQVGEQLAMQVQDVYRLNGIDAEVTVEKRGVVSVFTRELDATRLQRVQDLALKDVAGLDEIITDNQPAARASADENNDAHNDPGKRITMIIPGESPYIVTVDRSRYYVGAMLPSGHKVIEINQDSVLLVKGGVETVLNF